MTASDGPRAPHGYAAETECFLRCPECGHCYATEDELLAEHNGILADLGMEAETSGASVDVCPLCTHSL